MRLTVSSVRYTVETRFYDRRSNDIPDLAINSLCPGKSYCKLFEAEFRFNNIPFNDIPGLTMERALSSLSSLPFNSSRGLFR